LRFGKSAAQQQSLDASTVDGGPLIRRRQVC
jgi:hypothetical protein